MNNVALITDTIYYHSQSLLFAVYYQILLISIIIIATQCNDIHCINTLVRQSLPSYSFHPRNPSKVLSACCPCREYDLICSRKENRIWIIIILYILKHWIAFFTRYDWLLNLWIIPALFTDSPPVPLHERRQNSRKLRAKCLPGLLP